jgi:hypothetical protein|tara:strand:- start:36349 stop:37035 length:687 start_codon:yes stop_codon:yes gene_type:complete
MKSNYLTKAFIAGILVTFGAAATAAKEMPQTTPEGMNLIKETKTRVVYAMPEATLDVYTKVALIDCYVAFEKNWERDYNRDASFTMRIQADDMEAIKKSLADEFRKVFTEELTKAGHEVVDHTGADVLVLRPAIINLDVSAPDVKTAAYADVIVRSAGSMTLYMELFDSTTNAVIARIIDGEADTDSFAQRANSVTNKAAADRILRGWATELASHLGAAQEDTADSNK